MKTNLTGPEMSCYLGDKGLTIKSLFLKDKHIVKEIVVGKLLKGKCCERDIDS